MPQVIVSIDGKTYRMACAEGEEDHLAGLAADVDRRIAELRKGFGEIGDLRLTVMAAIMIADDLSEARRQVTGLKSDVEEARRAGEALGGGAAEREAALARRFDEAAEGVEAILSRLSSP